MTVPIRINGKSLQTPSGLVKGEQLYNLADYHSQRLFLSRDGDIDIPILPEEHLLIRGNENFVVGNGKIEDDPPLRRKIRPEFNGTRDTIDLSSACQKKG